MAAAKPLVAPCRKPVLQCLPCRRVFLDSVFYISNIVQVRSILFRKRLKQISADFRFGPIWLILVHFKPPGAQPSGFRDSGRSLHSKGTHFSKPIFPTFSTTLGTTSPVNIIQKKIKILTGLVVAQTGNGQKLAESWPKVDQKLAEIINTTIRMGRASRASLGLLFFVFRQTFGQHLANFRPTLGDFRVN